MSHQSSCIFGTLRCELESGRL